MVCPNCHKLSGLTRTAPRTYPPVLIVDLSSPTPPLPVYPDWLRRFDEAAQQKNDYLSELVKDSAKPKVVRDLALALLLLHYRKPLDTRIDLASVETEVQQWLAQRQQ